MFPRSFEVPKRARSKTFTVSGTYTPDPTATWIYVEGIGGGQAGGTYFGQGPSGGDGGVWDWALIPASSLTGPVAVVIGSGGVAVNNASILGPVGGDTAFGNFLICKGGGNAFNIDGTGGAGSISGSASIGRNSLRGGAGGGGGTYTSGTPAAGGTSLRGGNGGAGSNSTSAATSGTAPGGGGGGNGNGLGGNGAPGQLIVYWW